MATVPAFLAEEIARSGESAFDIHAIHKGGNTETRGELRLASTKIRRLSSKTQPSKIKSCTITGNGAVEVSLKSCGSKVATRWRLSIGTESLRAVCCLRAFKNTSGRKKSLNVTGFSNTFFAVTRFTQSPFNATILFDKPCKNTAGSSGADG